jgi:decaprenylphospho-beta-D-erythro-pentofuranosid-2-ulose 2-reductase
MTRRVLIVGAGSAIARAVARRLAGEGAHLALAARDRARLEADGADLRLRGAADVRLLAFDAHDGVERHVALLDEAFKVWGGLDVVLIAHGVLPDQAASADNPAQVLTSLQVNAASTIGLMSALTPRLIAPGQGVLAVIASPAGERGRRSNYVYGAGKAAVITFAAGLRHRLHGSGVRVLTVQPGFVDTPMTAAFAKGALWVTPGRVADDIVRALAANRGGTLYTPGGWRWVMALVRALPEALFVRTKL